MEKRFVSVLGGEYVIGDYKSIEDLMEVGNDDVNENVYAITKKVYQNDCIKGRPQYRYVVEGSRTEDGYNQYMVYLVPEFSCLHEKHQQVLKDARDKTPTPWDVFYADKTVLIDYSESKKSRAKLSMKCIEEISNTLDMIDRFFSVNMDRCNVDRLGTRNWAELDDLLYGKDKYAGLFNK